MQGYTTQSEAFAQLIVPDAIFFLSWGEEEKKTKLEWGHATHIMQHCI